MKMKYKICFMFVLLTLLSMDGVTGKRRRVERLPTHSETNEISSNGEDDIMTMLEVDEQEEAKRIRLDLEKGFNRDASSQSNQDEIIDNRVPLSDPCAKVHCGAGRVCQIDDFLEPVCVCIEQCREETEPRRMVCSNHNETWPSDCSIYQQRCFCVQGDTRCRGPEYKHVHIEYYGSCREMPECSDEEMSDFPRRMRDWLYNVMSDMADREELPKHYVKMKRDAGENHHRRWTNAAIWKWCDLDGHPADRAVSRHELFPIRAPLMTLEHCIAPFLDGCDLDNNHRISLKEWAKCLELDEENIQEKCENIADSSNF